MATNYLQGVNVGNGVADAYFRAGQVAKDVGNSFREKELADYKIQLAAQEREDRLKQQAIDNKRADAMLAMQQNQEQRAIDALAKTEATQKAALGYTNVLGNYGKDVVTEAQASDLLAKFNTGKDVQADYARKVAEYNASPEMKRDMLNQLVVPTEMDGKVVDPTMLINLKNSALEGQQKQADTLKQQLFQEKQTDKQLAASKDIALMNKATQLQVAGMNIAAADKRIAKELEISKSKLLNSPENIKTRELTVKLADTEFKNLDAKTKKLYNNDLKSYMTSNYDRLTQAAREDILNPKAKDYSVWTSTVGNPDDVAEFIADAKALGKTDTQIQRALSGAPKGSSIFDIGLPELNVEYAKKILNNN